jgi:hypothetical protein
MVKFSPGDQLITIIAAKLREIPKDKPLRTPQEGWAEKPEPDWLTLSRPTVQQSATAMMGDFPDPLADPEFWDMDCRSRPYYYLVGITDREWDCSHHTSTPPSGT